MHEKSPMFAEFFGGLPIHPCEKAREVIGRDQEAKEVS
jgi:hypothetical protein